MSAPQTNPDRKPIVAAVLVLFAVGAAVNAMVSRPGKTRPKAAAVRVQAAQPLPADIGTMRATSGVPGNGLAVWGARAHPQLRRDPFGGTGVNPDDHGGMASAANAAGGKTPPTGPQPLACQAVLFGGGRPTALINGHRYHVGDTVRGFRITAVTRLGVKLFAADSGEQLLSVRSGRSTSVRGRIVSGKDHKESLGSTSLVEHARGERK